MDAPPPPPSTAASSGSPADDESDDDMPLALHRSAAKRSPRRRRRRRRRPRRSSAGPPSQQSAASSSPPFARSHEHDARPPSADGSSRAPAIINDGEFLNQGPGTARTSRRAASDRTQLDLLRRTLDGSYVPHSIAGPSRTDDTPSQPTNGARDDGMVSSPPIAAEGEDINDGYSPPRRKSSTRPHPY